MAHAVGYQEGLCYCSLQDEDRDTHFGGVARHSYNLAYCTANRVSVCQLYPGGVGHSLPGLWLAAARRSPKTKRPRLARTRWSW
jgi:hypothetical protein